MADKNRPIVSLSEMVDGQDADLFALLTSKEELKTRDGKPYFRVGFRDAKREVNFPIWGDSPWAADCRDAWTVGEFFKLRAIFRDTNYGPQLDIRKIRPVLDEDREEGFDPAMCLPRSRFDAEEMFAELIETAQERIDNPALAALAVDLLETNRAELLTLPAAKRNHHAFASGWLEHVVSVVRSAVFFADKYADYYPEMTPPLDKGLVTAGAILHDIGKLHELEQHPQGADYTASGNLIGHILQGRDLVRDLASKHKLDKETLLRLEHIIVSHQRLPEWGSPKPPMTPEAMIVHYADDLDAKYHMMAMTLCDDTTSGPMTSNRNALGQRVFRGLGEG